MLQECTHLIVSHALLTITSQQIVNLLLKTDNNIDQYFFKP